MKTAKENREKVKDIIQEKANTFLTICDVAITQATKVGKNHVYVNPKDYLNKEIYIAISKLKDFGYEIIYYDNEKGRSLIIKWE